MDESTFFLQMCVETMIHCLASRITLKILKFKKKREIIFPEPTQKVKNWYFSLRSNEPNYVSLEHSFTLTAHVYLQRDRNNSIWNPIVNAGTANSFTKVITWLRTQRTVKLSNYFEGQKLQFQRNNKSSDGRTKSECKCTIISQGDVKKRMNLWRHLNDLGN